MRKMTNHSGHVSDAVQNLMMGHASMTTFVKHYLSRRITVNTEAVLRGTEPQDAMMRASATMSRTIDRRRPDRLTLAQSLSVNKFPEVQTLLERREQLGQDFSRMNDAEILEYRDLGRQINRERQFQRRALRKKYRMLWDAEQPVRDVERQIAGLEVEAQPETLNDAMLPSQVELANSILSEPETTIQQERCRRNRAIDAVALHCSVEEGGMNSMRTKERRAKSQSEHESEALEVALLSVYQDRRPRRCWKCVGNVNLPVAERVYEFGRSGDLTRHFDRKHLRNIKEGDSLGCELCEMALDDKEHLQRHGLDVHGTVSKT